jgi:phosphate/sulfate permease
LPSSSTHALFGGLIAAAIIGAGFDAVNFGLVLMNVVIPAILSPVVAGVVALVATHATYRITQQAKARGSAPASGTVRRSRLRSSRSGTARTMPRRPWASSRAPSSPPGIRTADRARSSG